MAKRLNKQDPFADRERDKYEHPIPSRECIQELLQEAGTPLDIEQVCKALTLSEDRDVDALSRRLRAMERDGQIIQNRRGGYGLVSKMDLVCGRVIGHPDGYGFFVADEGGEDLYLSPKQMRSLLHGDRAVVRKAGVDRRGRREGALVDVLERANHRVVGRYVVEHGLGFVIPSNKRIHQDLALKEDGHGGAQDGQIVVAEIIEQPSWRSQPIGKVIEIVGNHLAPGMEIDIAMRSYELPHEWPDSVLEEISTLTPRVPDAAKHGRVDLRDVPLVTIDGEDARDFDDAVYCEKHGKGWRLLVAIADVSHYVAPATALDDEGRNRGNSVYFPGRVIPMLPEVLSNGLCSLNPDEDRLCMVCEMFVTAAGKVRDYRFFEGVMRSHARLTYTSVAAMVVERDSKELSRYKKIVPHLEELYALYKALQVQRQKRGTIDFETVETRIVFGDDRKIQAIVPVVRNDAHRMIEEFMIAANVAAADFLLTQEQPAVYRVHLGPSPEKLADVRAFLRELGLRLGGGDDPEPKHYAKLLDEVRERPDRSLIQTVLLRSLSQAVYTPENNGHFGLAFEAYTHFTSPIRRYPDLLVHRAIRHLLASEPKKPFVYTNADMLLSGEHCSMTERRADEATRDAVDWLKCEFMQGKVGEEFEGTISAVTSFGIFVQLKNIYIEGLVHVTALQNDYYHFDSAKHRLVGERTKMMYRLTDQIKVKVMRVNLDDKKIDFEIAGMQTTAPSPKSRRA